VATRVEQVRAEVRKRTRVRGAAKGVAQDLGISPSTLSRIARGISPPPDHVAEALGFRGGREPPEIENEEAVLDALRRRLKVRGAARQIADAAGVTTALLSMIKGGRRRPNLRVAEALGFRRVVRFERVE
jgi:transcriptional regulator with XRE-family HTH domain